MCDICFDTVFAFSNKSHIQLKKELNIDELLNKVAEQLFANKKVDRKTRNKQYQSYNAPLQAAIQEGYGKPIYKLEYGTPNYEFLKNLKTNTAVFSMFKAHASIQEMAAKLTDSDGNLRSKEDFKKEALKVDNTYRVTHLETQYDTATRTARLASQWQRIQKAKRLYPNLKYLLTKASKPDDAHLKFVGIIQPVDSIFWQTHYPPNRWRCQCGVEQTDEEPTDVPNNLPDIPADFAFNAGAVGKIFDLENSEYIKKATAAEIPKLIKDAKQLINEEIAAAYPYYSTYKSKSDGAVEVHPLTFLDKDFTSNFNIAKELANNGSNVKMLPAVETALLRESLHPASGIKGVSNPDFQIGEDVFDAKIITGTSKHTVKHSLNACNQQCDNVVMVFQEDHPLSFDEVVSQITTKTSRKEMNNFRNVWVKYDGEWTYNPHKK